MPLWVAAVIVFLAGAFTSFVSTISTGNKRFEWPSRAQTPRAFDFGSFAEILAGALSALVLWALYGPVAKQLLWSSVSVPFTLSDLGGAMITGFGGGRTIKALVEARESRTDIKELRTSIDTLASAIAEKYGK